jgi:hypothetical protein
LSRNTLTHLSLEHAYCCVRQTAAVSEVRAQERTCDARTRAAKGIVIQMFHNQNDLSIATVFEERRPSRAAL